MFIRAMPLVILLAIQWLPISLNAAEDPVLIPTPPRLDARSYVLLDADSGRMLVAENADERLPPASLTKMMTSYILSSELAKGNLHADDLVPISRNAWAQNPVFKGSSRMFIEVGKKVRLDALQKGVIISSGSDAAVAVAEFIAGSEDSFTDLMNHRAELLGMRNSRFANAHGLPAQEQYSTARDMALLAQAIIRDFPEDYSLYAERSFSFNDIAQSNRNKLLWQDPSVDGLKTGYTQAAGYSLVASARRDDMRLIAVVMGARSADARAQENQKLLQYGFRYYETLKLYDAGQAIAQIKVWSGAEDRVAMGVLNDVYVTIPRGKREALTAELEFDDVIEAPIATGQALGLLRLNLDGAPLLRGDAAAVSGDAEGGDAGEALTPALVALGTVEQAGLVARLWDAMMLFFYQLFGTSTTEVS